MLYFLEIIKDCRIVSVFRDFIRVVCVRNYEFRRFVCDCCMSNRNVSFFVTGELNNLVTGLQMVFIV